MAKPKFLYDQRFNDATPVASSTAAGDFNELNLRDWRPYTWWKPSAMPATVTVNSGAAIKPKTGSATVTFTRAGTATRVNGLGLVEVVPADVPRFDHDSVTKALKGLLIERVRTNLCLHSEAFDNAVWIKQAGVSVVANAANGPDGNLTADRVDWSGAAVGAGIFQGSLAVSTTTANSKSIYVRADVAGGTIGLADPSFTVGETILALTTSWQRGSLSEIQSGGLAGVWVRKKADSPASIYLWGGQLENAPLPGSYIPTTAAAVTRNADVMGLVLGALYNALEGTFFCEFIRPDLDGAQRYLAQVDDGTTAERLILTTQANDTISNVIDGGALQATLQVSSFAANAAARLAFAYKANDFAASLNGGAVATDIAGSLPTVTTLRLGGGGAVVPDVEIDGHLRRFRYYPRRLSNADLVTLSGGGEIGTQPSLAFDFVKPLGAADYLLLYGDLATQGATVEVRGSMDNFAASDVLLASKKPASDLPLLSTFDLHWYPYWRLRFTGASAPSVAIAALGAALEAPVYLEGQFDPTSRRVYGQTNRNENGHPLGRAVYFEGWEASIRLPNVSWSWVRDSFLPAWKSHLRGSPFGFVWDSDKYPEDVRLVQAGDQVRTPHRAGELADVELDVEGVAP